MDGSIFVLSSRR